MHMDDAGLTDVKGHAMTLTGGAARSATQSKFGGYSAHFDGVDDQIMNTGSIWELQWVPAHSIRFFCYPETQVDTDPCVFQFRSWRLEYKPSGYTSGFVLYTSSGRITCGVHPEGQWYFIQGVEAEGLLTLSIDGLLIGTFQVGGSVDSWFCLGSARLGYYPGTAFKGYVDDLLLTGDADPTIEGHRTRWDLTVPTAAFYEYEPDPQGSGAATLGLLAVASGLAPPNGPVLATLAFEGPGAGIASAIGTARGSVGFGKSLLGTVPQAGRASGRIAFSGGAEGDIGRVCSGSGSVLFKGNAAGTLGMAGGALGGVRFSAEGFALHGRGGVFDGALRLSAEAVGYTPMRPTGLVAGSLRVAGNAGGYGNVLEDTCH